MSKKVTGKDLEKLLERYSFEPSGSNDKKRGQSIMRNLGISTSGKGRDKVAIAMSKLPKLKPDQNVFTTSDAVKAKTGNDPDLKRAATIASTQATSDAGKEFKKEYEAELEKTLRDSTVQTSKDFQATDSGESIDIDSFSFPRPLADLSTSGEGKFLGSQNELIKSIFSGFTLKERLETITLISDSLSDSDETLKNRDARELLQFTMMADLFDLFLNQVDQRAGGYLFESFLANLVGGSVVGGSNGIADFKTGDNSLGSSKLLNSWKSITQSSKGLTEPGQSIHYVIGLHDAGEQEGRRTKIDLYYVIITLAKINEDGSKVVIFSDADGNKKNADLIKGKEPIKISYNNQKEGFKVGEFSLSSNGEDYRERLNSFLQSEEDSTRSKSGQALKAMKSFFKSLYDAEEGAKKFVAADTEESLDFGNKALKDYDDADQYLQQLLNILTPDKKVSGEKGDRKITAEQLQKLIEETLNK
jgi:hypothetical protein